MAFKDKTDIWYELVKEVMYFSNCNIEEALLILISPGYEKYTLKKLQSEN